MSWLPRIAIVMALLALGFGLGRITSVSPLDNPERSSPPAAPQAETADTSGPAQAALLAEVRSALNEARLLERTTRSTALLSQLGPENAEAFFATYREEHTAQFLVDLLIDQWIRFDPQTAFDRVQAASDLVAQETNPALLEGWALFDPQAARRAYESIQPEDGPKLGPAAKPRYDAISALVRGWSRSGQPGLTDFLSRQEQGSRTQRWLDLFLAERLEQVGPEWIAEWAETVVDNDDYDRVFKQLAVSSAAGAIGRHDPEYATSWAEGYADTDFARPVIGEVAKAWAKRDGAAAMNWLARLPDSRSSTAAVSPAFRIWVAQNQDAAVGWARANAGKNPLWDPAIDKAADYLVSSEPLEAVTLVGSIDDPQRRRRALIRVGRIWYSEAPGPAVAWMEASKIDDELRSEIEKGRTRGRSTRDRSSRSD